MFDNENLIPETDVFLPWKEPQSPSNYRVKPKPRRIVNMGIKQLSPMHRKALENIAKNPTNPTKAVIEAGFSPSNAAATADKLLHRKPILKALEDKGGTDEEIAEVMIEGMKKAENPFRPGFPDHVARLGFVKEINRVKDNYPASKISVTKEVKEMHVHFTAENLTQFKKYNDIRMGSREEVDV